MEVLRLLGRRLVLGLLLYILGVTALSSSVLAAQCQTVAGQEVCILTLRRSAKHYWEYWAKLSINGAKQPERIYDCRVFAKDRSRSIPAELTAETVKAESVGSLVCRLYRS